jgi:phenylpropionate dioxygenase-like ring-hydroxylating dioxygenase large terminal subunit
MPPLPDVTRFFHPIWPAKKLDRGPVQVKLAGRTYALFRDGAGKPAILADRCPHRFAPLSAGRVRPDGRLACGYHGWHFDAQGRGPSPSLPMLSKCDVQSYRAVEYMEYIWMAAPGTPDGALPRMAYEDHHFAGTFQHLFQAPLHVALDNFAEDEHTPWVHTRLGWNEDRCSESEIEFSAENHPDRTEVSYRGPQRPSPLLIPLRLRPGDVFHNHWTTRFDPVCTEYRIHWTAPDGSPRPFGQTARIYFVPETEDTTRLVTFSFLRLFDARWALLKHLIGKVALVLGRSEVSDDQRWIPNVKNTPFDMKGMRLGKYDKPLIHNHRLLSRLYWGAAAEGQDGHGDVACDEVAQVEQMPDDTARAAE